MELFFGKEIVQIIWCDWCLSLCWTWPKPSENTFLWLNGFFDLGAPLLPFTVSVAQPMQLRLRATQRQRSWVHEINQFDCLIERSSFAGCVSPKVESGTTSPPHFNEWKDMLSHSARFDLYTVSQTALCTISRCRSHQMKAHPPLD